MWYADVIGQESALKQFRRVLENNRLGHAYVFYGPSGVGKRKFALQLSKGILCLQGMGVGCGTCEACLKVEHGTHPDLIFVEPTENRKSITIAQIRYLTSLLSRSIHEGRKRIVIIDPFDVLTEEGDNAFLKTLEEPGRDTVFLLISSNLAQIRPTILSRCQLIRFRSLTGKETEEFLRRESDDAELISTVSMLAAGSGGAASRLLAQENIIKDWTEIVDWFFELDTQSALESFSRLDQKEKEKWNWENFLFLWRIWQNMLRDLLTLSFGASEKELNFPHLADRYLIMKPQSSFQLTERIEDCRKAISLLKSAPPRNPYVIAEAILTNWRSEI